MCIDPRDESLSWMTPIIAYLEDGILPEEPGESLKIRRKAARFWLSPTKKIYRRSYLRPYLLCVHPTDVTNLLGEIHEGCCGGHIGGRSLAHRVMSQGCWWPYMHKDSLQFVQKCEWCQRFGKDIHQPAEQLNMIASPWPFDRWGIDIIGPMPRAAGNFRFLIVAIDYCTKWIEAEPLIHIRESDTERFVWKNIITRFGARRALVTDNGKQFEGSLQKLMRAIQHQSLFLDPSLPTVQWPGWEF